MKPTIEQIGDLLALKREERPREGYWEDFLCDFHRNEREKAVRKSGFSGLVGRFGEWFSERGPSKWAYGAGLAYSAVTLAFVLSPREDVKENLPASPVNYQVVPTPAPPAVEQLDQLDLSPETQGRTGEQVY